MNSDAYHESRRRLAGMNGSTGVGCLVVFEGRQTAAIWGRRPLVPVLVSRREGGMRGWELMTGSLTSVRFSRAASSLVRFFAEERCGFGSALDDDDDDGATRTFDARSDSL